MPDEPAYPARWEAEVILSDGGTMAVRPIRPDDAERIVRFHERRHNPLKQWKLTDIDLAAIGKWDDYTRALADMFRFTHTPSSPWWVVHANDQRRARLEAIRLVLSAFDYADKDAAVAHAPDPKIVGNSDAFLYGKPTDT